MLRLVGHVVVGKNLKATFAQDCPAVHFFNNTMHRGTGPEFLGLLSRSGIQEPCTLRRLATHFRATEVREAGVERCWMLVDNPSAIRLNGIRRGVRKPSVLSDEVDGVFPSDL